MIGWYFGEDSPESSGAYALEKRNPAIGQLMFLTRKGGKG